MALTEQQIRQITDEIVRSLSGSIRAETAAPAPKPQPAESGRWLCDTAEEAVQNAKAAQAKLADMTLEKRGELIAAMRKAGIDNAEYLARLAHEETGYGHVEDKIQKNLLVSRRTPGIEDLQTRCETGDKGMMLIEQAPFGVIGSITPSTNPTSTVINNSISMIAAGNAVVFNPHPAAKHASQEAMRLMVEAIVSAGGPAALITTVKEPTLETGQAIMTHPDIPLLSITGGEAVVRVAMKTGKKVIVMEPVKGGTLSQLLPEADSVFDRLEGRMSNAAYALRFVMGLENVSVILSGMSTPAQVEENTDLFLSAGPLSDEEMKAVDEVRDITLRHGAIACTACRYCTEVCPVGMPVPEIFSLMNSGKEEGYDRITEKTKAGDCLHCGKCEAACPQHLPVRRYLDQAAFRFEK